MPIASVDQHLTVTSPKLIKKQCEPLHLFNMTGFCHDITFSHGQLSMLGTHPSIFKLWYEKNLPTLCTNEDGRTLDAGVYLGAHFYKKYLICKKLHPAFLSEHSATQSLHIVERDNDCQHFYSFSFNQTEEEFLHLIINHIHDFHNFIEYYKRSSAKLIFAIKKNKNRIHLPIHFSDDKKLVQLPSNKICLIHNDIKTPIYLSKQQSLCLTLFFQNMTTKQIAQRMNLSHRTVEHYLARIRKILNCNTSKEMIIKYGDQIISHIYKS